MAGLISYIEENKVGASKVKTWVWQEKKQEVSRVINQQFNTVPGRVFANLSKKLKRETENERPRYKDPGKRARNESRMFENIEKASGFWRKLWEERGTGNKNVAWLQEAKVAIHEQVPPPTGNEWALEVADAVKVIHWFIPFIFAFNKKYNNSIQKYIKDNIRTIFQLNYYKIKYGKGKEAYTEAGGL